MKSLQKGSTVTIIVIVLAIAVLGTGGWYAYKLHFVDVIRGQRMTEIDLKNRTIEISIRRDASSEQVFAMRNAITVQTGVAEVRILSAEDNLAAFKERHKDDEFTLQALNELQDNPYGPSIIVIVSDPSQKDSLRTFIKEIDKNSIIENVKTD
jgi:cell division protein FtsX